MKWVITGNRAGHPLTYRVLDELVRQLGRPELVVLGDARGVDAEGWAWCLLHGIDFVRVEACWYVNGVYDPTAGHERNGWMLDAGGLDALVVGFPVGASPGTRNCLRQARMRGMRFVCFEG